MSFANPHERTIEPLTRDLILEMPLEKVIQRAAEIREQKFVANAEFGGKLTQNQSIHNSDFNVNKINQIRQSNLKRNLALMTLFKSPVNEGAEPIPHFATLNILGSEILIYQIQIILLNFFSKDDDSRDVFNDQYLVFKSEDFSVYLLFNEELKKFEPIIISNNNYVTHFETLQSFFKVQMSENKNFQKLMVFIKSLNFKTSGMNEFEIMARYLLTEYYFEMDDSVDFDLTTLTFDKIFGINSNNFPLNYFSYEIGKYVSYFNESTNVNNLDNSVNLSAFDFYKHVHILRSFVGYLNKGGQIVDPKIVDDILLLCLQIEHENLSNGKIPKFYGNIIEVIILKLKEKLENINESFQDYRENQTSLVLNFEGGVELNVRFKRTLEVDKILSETTRLFYKITSVD